MFTGNGLAFKNRHKRNSKDPDYRGEICVDGKDYEIFLREKSTQESGEPFFSISMREIKYPQSDRLKQIQKALTSINKQASYSKIKK